MSESGPVSESGQTTVDKYLAISGGVGGAKLALGLARVLEPQQLSIVTNTADDFDHLGLRICPDLDTVMYTLADLSNKEQGWGLEGETWNFLDALRNLGGDTWFQLGDRDLATHITRTTMLNQGSTLSEVTSHLCNALGVKQHMFPMTDARVATRVLLKAGGQLSFQHYFVRDRCKPEVIGFRFDDINAATPSPALQEALGDPQLAAVIVCPSNPFVSVDPILSIPGLRQLLKDVPAPVIAVSPIVGGQALKGPTAKMMQELNMPQSAVSVAQHYADLLDGFVLDHEDVELRTAVEDMGIATIVTSSVMITLEDRIQLAEDTLSFSRTMTKGMS
jgi:LPPG:FO 2-phospho-L-lactate transferase